MSITTLFNELGVSKLALAWKYLTGGWASIAKYLCEKLSKLLSRLAPEKLVAYAELIQKVAELVRKIIDLFVTDDAKKNAGLKTVEAIENLAKRISDGDFTTEELDETIEEVKICIDAWKAL